MILALVIVVMCLCVCVECVFEFVNNTGWSSEPRCFITSEITLGLTGCDE